MKLGELVFDLVVKGSDKKLDDAYKKAKKSQELSSKQAKIEKVLGRELTKKEKGILKNALAFSKMATSALAVVGAVSTAVVALDRMADALSRTNQKMINLQRQTGLSFSSINKYSSASASVNYNSTEEQVAQSMQRVQNRLWEIQHGIGDFDAFQLLANKSGILVDTWGKSVEEVIEGVREAIKNVDDVSATNIITRMGFNADDLLMLRMPKEEVEKIKTSYFLTAEQREEMYKYSLALKKVHLQFDYLYKRFILLVLKGFDYGYEKIAPVIDTINNIVDSIGEIIDKAHSIKPIFEILDAISNAIYDAMYTPIYLIEDILAFFAGKESGLGLLKENLKGLTDIFVKMGDALLRLHPLLNTAYLLFNAIPDKIKFNQNRVLENAIPNSINNSNKTTNNNANINNNVAVYTQQPVTSVLDDVNNMSLANVQMTPIQ